MNTKNLLFLISAQFLASSVLLGGHNYDYEIRSTCYHSHTKTYDEDCYPFWYENTEGKSNIFGNFVAVLNYVNPVISICGLRLNYSLIKRWNNKINESINDQLKNIKDGEMHVRDLLSEIIKEFDNGINRGTDQDIASALIERLNLHRCENCIKKFVSIVSKNNEKSRGNEDVNTDNNLLEFYALAENMRRSHFEKCEDFKEIVRAIPDKPGIIRRAGNACCYNWNYPFHFSSLAYMSTALVIPPCLSFVLDTDNHAGAFIGDMANLSNILVIPTIHAYSIIQNWRNYDRIKAQRLVTEISQRLEGIEGIIEIAGQVIGTMDNNINSSEAKGFLKILIILGWPDAKVQEFMKLAARQSDNISSFISAIKIEYDNHKITYKDCDIQAAFGLLYSIEEVITE